ncbi:MAG TPA: YdcF family protein [Rhizomicrobium sp.]|nr:YdcF family protein [Rhizomicrobium sp.]
MIRGFLTAMLLVALGYGLAFVLFVSTLPAPPETAPEADGIVALTGGGPRLAVAVDLFEKGVGKRLLISGVAQATSRQTLKEVAHGGPRFDCCTDIGYAAEDTRGNAAEAAAWAHGHRFQSIVVVTARYHMPRAIREFKNVMPDVTLLPYAVDQDSVDLSRWWLHSNTVLLLHREFVKYLASLVTALAIR